MSDAFAAANLAALTASNLELSQQLAELRERLPQAPVMDMSRAAFDAMSGSDKAAFCKRGGRIHDPAGPDRSPLAAPGEMPKAVLRSVWERWPASDRARFIREGGKLHDR